MKKLFILITVILSFATAKAQVFWDDGKEMVKNEQEMKDWHKKNREMHLANLQSYFYPYKDGKTENNGRLISDAYYDNEGNMVDYRIYNHKGKIKENYLYRFNTRGKMVERIQLGKNRKFINKFTYEYDSAGNQIKSCGYFFRDNNMTWTLTAKYDEKRNILERAYTLKNGKPSLKYVYSYYPDGSKKQTVEYDRKGKVAHSWNYECNPIGELAAKHLKDSSKICVKYENDNDGNPIKIVEETIKRGDLIKLVDKYDKNGNNIEHLSYDFKGRIMMHTVYKFDLNNNLAERIVYKMKSNEIQKRYVFTHDKDGNVIEGIYYKKGNLPVGEYKYSYVKEN